MALIKLSGFTGEQPRIIPRLMQPNAAQSAINTRLDDGGLTPMRKSAAIATASASDYQTIYRFGETWLGWTGVVNAAPGPVATDRLYYTGDGSPKMRVGADVYGLAITPPAAALTAELSGLGSGDVVSRTYVYTWVSSFGEESEPSPASAAIDWQPGYDVALSSFAATPADRAITLQRIYRSQTGQSGTYFYLIAERSAGTGDFTDDVAVDAFQEPLPSASWNAPPAGLEGLISLPNGMMAAFVGKDLYFCEPYRPHAWPEKYVLTMDATIVGLGAMGTSVVVLTTGMPHLVTGTSPETMQMQRIEQNFPCINARGIVDLGFAIAFPSNEGVVVARPDGGMALATGNIFNRDDWLALSPSTMIGGQHLGRYVAFYDAEDVDGAAFRGTLLFDLTGQSFLIRNNAEASAAYFEVSTGSLFYLARGAMSIRQLDAPNAGRLDQYWKSKQFVLSAPENFGVILIDATSDLSAQDADNFETEVAAVTAANAALLAAGSIGGDINAAALNEYPVNGDSLTPLPNNSDKLAVGVYADGELVASVARSNQPVRLPSGFRARTWEIDVFGNVAVENIVMAKTMDDLQRAPA